MVADWLSSRPSHPSLSALPIAFFNSMFLYILYPNIIYILFMNFSYLIFKVKLSIYQPSHSWISLYIYIYNILEVCRSSASTDVRTNYDIRIRNFSCGYCKYYKKNCCCCCFALIFLCEMSTCSNLRIMWKIISRDETL